MDPRALFSGTWRGAGELIPHGLARLVLKREAVAITGTGEWLSGAIWIVRERFEMGSGWSFERRMFMELVAPDRVRATADDIPLGANVTLTSAGFRFERFRSWLVYRGVRFRMSCESEARLDPSGALVGEVRLFFLWVPAATMRLSIRVEPSSR
ncbi:MAG: hypothetical protein FJ091_04575 [Deltaproteobacteria bacterium]|nr:hypothetical protein [Deltaproteobacteria bacterium]